MQRIKVLIYTESWGVGGIEAYVMGILKSLNSNQFGFRVFSVHDTASVFDEELAKLGVNRLAVYHNIKPNQAKRLICGLHAFNDAIREYKPDVVHINTMNGMGFAYAWVAKRNNVPVRIVHSHNSDVGTNLRNIKRLIGTGGRLIFGGTENVRLACSAKAGRYLFNQARFMVVNNGIDTTRFCFSKSFRKETRERLGIQGNATLLGNPSRLSKGKNPLLQLKIFKGLLEINPNSYYLLMEGQGEIENEVSNYIQASQIGRHVIRIKPRSDIEKVYSALDLMIFPSEFEGLPFAILEAQSCLLPVVSSSAVSEEAIVTNLVKRAKSDSVDEYIELAVESLKLADSREENPSPLKGSAWDVEKSVSAIEEIYRAAVTDCNDNERNTPE